MSIETCFTVGAAFYMVTTLFFTCFSGITSKRVFVATRVMILLSVLGICAYIAELGWIEERWRDHHEHNDRGGEHNHHDEDDDKRGRHGSSLFPFELLFAGACYSTVALALCYRRGFHFSESVVTGSFFFAWGLINIVTTLLGDHWYAWVMGFFSLWCAGVGFHGFTYGYTGSEKRSKLVIFWFTVFWILYEIVYLCGHDVAGWIGASGTAFWCVFLDILFMIVVGCLLMSLPTGKASKYIKNNKSTKTVESGSASLLKNSESDTSATSTSTSAFTPAVIQQTNYYSTSVVAKQQQVRIPNNNLFAPRD